MFTAPQPLAQRNTSHLPHVQTPCQAPDFRFFFGAAGYKRFTTQYTEPRDPFTVPGGVSPAHARARGPRACAWRVRLSELPARACVCGCVAWRPPGHHHHHHPAMLMVEVHARGQAGRCLRQGRTPETRTRPRETAADPDPGRLGGSGADGDGDRIRAPGPSSRPRRPGRRALRPRFLHGAAGPLKDRPGMTAYPRRCHPDAEGLTTRNPLSGHGKRAGRGDKGRTSARASEYRP